MYGGNLDGVNTTIATDVQNIWLYIYHRTLYYILVPFFDIVKLRLRITLQ